jgi:hypothetical protein
VLNTNHNYTIPVKFMLNIFGGGMLN